MPGALALMLPDLCHLALVATLVESLIGATLQRRLPWLSNELVNGLQTLIAALLAMLVGGSGRWWPLA